MEKIIIVSACFYRKLLILILS